MPFHRTLVIVLACLLIPSVTLAHHSFSAEFDIGRPVKISGSVITVEWTNPHAWIHLAVENDQGATEEWAVEMLGVITLVRSGMSPQTVKPGDKLTITGYGARNGSNTANASSVTRTDTGESLWASAGDDQ